MTADNQDTLQNTPEKSTKSVVKILFIIIVLSFVNLGLAAYTFTTKEENLTKPPQVTNTNITNEVKTLSLTDVLANAPALLHKIALGDGSTLFVIRSSEEHQGCFLGVTCGIFLLDPNDKFSFLGDLKDSDGSYEIAADNNVYFYSLGGDAGESYRSLKAYNPETALFSIVAKETTSVYANPTALERLEACATDTRANSTIYLYNNSVTKTFAFTQCGDKGLFRNGDDSYTEFDISTLPFISDEELLQTANTLGLKNDSANALRLSYEDLHNVYFELETGMLRFQKAN